ncbi:MAG: hypothetical protein Q7T67_04265, partial [Patulibacter sp.]
MAPSGPPSDPPDRPGDPRDRDADDWDWGDEWDAPERPAPGRRAEVDGGASDARGPEAPDAPVRRGSDGPDSSGDVG